MTEQSTSSTSVSFFPFFLLGSIITLCGLWGMTILVNSTWLVNSTNQHFLTVKRNAVLGQIDSKLLIDSSDKQLIALFLGCVLITGIGIGLFGSYFLIRRLAAQYQLPSTLKAWLFTGFRIGGWVGILLTLCTYLQMYRIFNLLFASLILLIFILIEALIVLRKQI